MKYPEVVYRIGNEFELNFEDEKKRIIFEWRNGYEMNFRANDNGGESFHQSCEELLTLVAITAETLAELARENDTEGTINFSFGFFGQDYVQILPSGVALGVDKFFRDKDEPLGEFFLRVAKERKYIK